MCGECVVNPSPVTTLLPLIGQVTSVNRNDNGQWSISLAHLGSPLVARRVVNASGFWAKELGQSTAGVSLPLAAVQHQYLVTSPIAETQNLTRELPVIRDLEGNKYYYYYK